MSRSFLIGDARVFERALSVCGLSASLNRIAGPEDIADRPGVIDVIHQQTVDPDKLPMGKVQALGGEAAYAAIRARSNWRWPGASPAWPPRRSTRNR